MNLRLKKFSAKRNPKTNLLKLDYITLEDRLSLLKGKELLSSCREVFAKSKNSLVLLTALKPLVLLALGKNLTASKMVENISAINPHYQVRHNAVKHLPDLAKKGIPISLTTLRRIRSDPIPTNRAFGLVTALEMVRKGNQRVLPEFIHSIRTEQYLGTWEVAENGLFELAQRGNKTAQAEIKKVESGIYKKPTKLTWTLKEVLS